MDLWAVITSFLSRWSPSPQILLYHLFLNVTTDLAWTNIAFIFHRYMSPGVNTTQISSGSLWYRMKTRKRRNCECIAIWGRLSHASPSSLYLTTPCQVWRRWTYQLPYYTVFLLLIHYSTPWTWPLPLWPWPLTCNVEHLQHIAYDAIKLCTKFKRNRTIRGGVIAISVYTYWTCFKCCARLWDNFHHVWPSTTYPYLNYSVFWCWYRYVMSSCDIDLWPVDLESSWYTECHLIKVCTKFKRNRSITGRIIDN